MGYHKKFITEELLRSIYENDGYQLMIENMNLISEAMMN